MRANAKIIVTGGAGLVGQNLITRLEARGFCNIVAIDKHRANTALLRRLHPQITIVDADLARDAHWRPFLADADVLIVSHAQIGGLDADAYTRNNVTATARVLDALAPTNPPFIVHLSSSVVTSMADDLYIDSKEAQERLIQQCGFASVILRPTLMFGWFDRKHLGWLARFMRRSPIMPIPGDGRFLRQPLYVGDFCEIVMACMAQRPARALYNISGLQKIDYVDLIRKLRDASGARARMIHIPYALFRAMLLAYGFIDRDPPFTAKQLDALATPDVFEVIDWPGLFGVTPTSLDDAFAETFGHPIFSKIQLEF
jgi:nucleoside-diphosphate-sugar epimerase